MRKQIRDLIYEALDGFFTGEDTGEGSIVDSVDDQIDSFIVKYEKDSIVEPEDTDIAQIQDSLNRLSMSSILNEQDAEVEAEGEEVEDDTTPTDEQDDDEEDIDTKLNIDIDEFTKRVARLAMNSETLLSVKAAVINRALEFIFENYDQEHLQRMKEILDSEYDFNIEGSENIPSDNFAAGAWAGGTGGMGGGV